MLPPRTILVPIDFSDNGVDAVWQARVLLQSADGELVLLHVIEPPYYPALDVVGAFDSKLVVWAQQRLEEIRDAEIGDRARVTLLVREGTPYVEIVRAAEEENVDMILLSTHGRTGVKHALLGSTAERVVRSAPCPVLTIRSRKK